jgi:hypothetical protein
MADRICRWGVEARDAETAADLGKCGRAGDGNRTRIASLEGSVSQRCDQRKRLDSVVSGRG